MCIMSDFGSDLSIVGSCGCLFVCLLGLSPFVYDLMCVLICF